jgi:hypothetical protein
MKYLVALEYSSIRKESRMMICPNCGCELEIALISTTHEQTTRPEVAGGQTSAAERTKNFVMNGTRYTLSNRDIIDAAAALEHPDTIQMYLVELTNSVGKSVEFPIKQVVRQALRTRFPTKFTVEEDRKSFTAQRARDVLTGLGFIVKRRY